MADQALNPSARPPRRRAALAMLAGTGAAVALPALAEAAADPLPDLERLFLDVERRLVPATARLDEARMAIIREHGPRLLDPCPFVRVAGLPLISEEMIGEQLAEGRLTAGEADEATVMLRELREHVDAVKARHGMPPLEAEVERLSVLWREMMERVATTPATTAAGLAVTARALRRELFDGETEFAEKLVDGPLADLDRLAGEAAHA